MNDANTTITNYARVSDELEFGKWRTPFENLSIEVLEVAYAPKLPWPDHDKPHYRYQSLLRSPGNSDLVARVYVYDANVIYRVVFSHIVAFRLIDEGGLLQFWEKTKELGGRPARTTFRVRNHLWAQESPIPFSQTNEGWSFVIASDADCLEVLSAQEPSIIEEGTSTSQTDADNG